MKKRNLKGSVVLNPVPVVLVTCKNLEGKDNVFTVAWVGTVCSKPPMLSISIRPERLSYDYIKETMEFTINLPTKKQTKEVDFCGVRSGRQLDKIKESGFTLQEGEKVKSSYIKECPVNIECKVKDILKISIIFLGVLGIFCSFFISLFSEYIGKIFFKEQDIILYVKRVLRIYSLSYVVVGINIFISAYFTAIKKVIYSALITFPRGILFNSILLLILPNIFGNKVIWMVSFLSEVLTIFICIYLLKKIKREGILS